MKREIMTTKTIKRMALFSSLLTTMVLADTNLGQKISVGTAEEEISYRDNSPIRPKPNVQTQARLETRVSPQNVKQHFKKDHHRYDKRYRNFNYDREAYYDNEGFYFGYYDTRGYFYNNIFFSYDNSYTYHDRRYRRGLFRIGHLHRRPYVHHTFNNWNRIHAYRQPNVIVIGNYYEPRYSPHYSRSNVVHNQYYNRPNRYNNPHNNHVRREYHQPQSGYSRMHVTRMQESRANSRNPHRNENHNFRNQSRNSMQQGHRPKGNYTRMQTHRGSDQGHKSGGRHMGISR